MRASERSILAMLSRFLVVGGVFSVTYAVVTAALIALGAPPFWTATLLYALAIPLAFLAQKRFTFGNETAQRNAFWVYLSTQLASFTLIASITTQFVMHNFLLDTVLYLMTAGAAAVISFLVNRSFAFSADA